MKKYLLINLLILLVVVLAETVQAQQNMLMQSQQMRQGETFIRVAEPGQLADTISVWGDVLTAGNYIVPRGTSLAKLLSFSRGPSRINTSETVLDWSQLRYQVHISREQKDASGNSFYSFSFKNNGEIPQGVRTTIIANRDIVILEVRRKPAFIDYVRVIAPILTAVSTTILIFINFNRL